MIPLTIDVPMKRLPWANWGLVLATVVLSIAVPYLPDEQFSFLPSTETNGHPFSFLVLQRNDFAPFQLVTSLFQHAGLLHLIGNMVFLFVFGNAIDAKLGHIGFLASYLGIGALVNLVWLAFGGGSACLGASGAIMGLCGMFLILYPFNGVQVLWNEFDFTVIFRSWNGEIPGWTGEIPGWFAVLLYLVFDIWGAIFNRGSNIAYVSHLVGAFLGMALALVLLGAGWLKPDRGEQTLLMAFVGQGPVERDESRRRRRRKRKSSSRIE